MFYFSHNIQSGKKGVCIKPVWIHESDYDIKSQSLKQLKHYLFHSYKLDTKP